MQPANLFAKYSVCCLTVSALFPLVLLLSSVLTASSEEQCMGEVPMTDLLYGTAAHYDVAERICCNNHVFAEYYGFHADVAFWPVLDANNAAGKKTVFYDSVCGKPLFVAPVGRSYSSFKKESLDHGWPSFRPEETVADNVKVLFGGRMESICGTHLGHNLPDFSGARYCIDLVCIAGKEVIVPGDDSSSTIVGSNTTNATVIANSTSSFDSENFKSLAGSLAQGQVLPTWFVVLLVAGGIVLVAAGFGHMRARQANAVKLRPLGDGV
jgi:peptide methionine sulfoxide reductase MsrB